MRQAHPVQRIVVDPNVLISAFDRLDGNPRQVVEDIVNGNVVVMAATGARVGRGPKSTRKAIFFGTIDSARPYGISATDRLSR